MRISPFPILAVAATAVVFASPSGALGQGVHYTSTTRVEFAGTMGTLMGAFGQEGPQESQTWMQDGRMRSDDGTTSTVFDLADGSYLFIDHESRTWFRTTFAEMMAAAEEAAAQATGAATGQPTDPDEAEAAAEEPAVEAEFSFDLDRTGERRSVSGYEAERVILTMEVEFLAETEEGEMQEAGDMVMINDLWISADFPTAASMMTDAEQLEWMEDMRTSGTETFSQIMAANPQVGTALERMQEEMEGLDGTTLESRAYVLMVMPGEEFDRDAVLALNEQPLSEGLGAVMGEAAGDAAKDAAADAARGAMGRLGGLFGRNREEEKEEPAVPAWSVLTRVTTLVTSIEPGPFAPAIFEPDPDYTERRPDWMGGD